MNFLVDAQLPPGLVRWSDEHGHTAFHVQEFDLADAEDRMIWDHALQIGAIILTKDDDLPSGLLVRLQVRSSYGFGSEIPLIEYSLNGSSQDGGL